MLHSYVEDLGPISLPPWQGRQKLGHVFHPYKASITPEYESYLDIVNYLCLLRKITTTIYMTIDESIVEPGQTQRRPEIHIDGCWIPEQYKSVTVLHDSQTVFNNIKRMPFIVCVNEFPCRVFEGDYDIPAQYHGNYDKFESILGSWRILEPNRAYYFSADCLHQSVPVPRKSHRSFFRIAFHDTREDEEFTRQSLESLLI